MSYVDYDEYSYSSWRPDPKRIGVFIFYEVDETDLEVEEKEVYIDTLIKPFDILSWKREKPLYIVTLYGSHGRYNKPIVIDQHWIEEDNLTVRKEIIDNLKINKNKITLYDEYLFIYGEQNYYEWEVTSDWHDPNFYRITIGEDIFNLFDVFEKLNKQIKFVMEED